MKRHSYHYFALLSAALATLFLFAGCSPDKEKAAALQREQMQKSIAVANELLYAGQADRAISQLEQLNQSHPAQPELIEALAFAYAQKPDHLMAALYFDRAYELLPTQGELALMAAQSHAKIGQLEQSANAYRAYLRHNPTDSASWRDLGQTELKLERNKPALDALLESIRLRSTPATGTEALQLARLYHSLGNQPQALRWYAEVVNQPSSNASERATALLGQFDIALRQKNWQEAVVIMHQLEKIAPNTLANGPYAQAHKELLRWEKELKENTAAAEKKNTDSTTAATKPSSTAPANASADKQPAAAATAATTTKPPTAEADTSATVASSATASQPTPAQPQPVATATVAQATTASASGPATGSTPLVITASGPVIVSSTSAATSATTPASTTSLLVTDAASAATASTATTPRSSKLPDEPIPSESGSILLIAEQASNSTNSETATTASATTTTPESVATGTPATQSSQSQPETAASLPEAVLTTESKQQTEGEKAEPVPAQKLYELGNRAFDLKEFEQAVSLLERAAEQEPENAAFNYQLSRAQFHAGRYKDAEASAEKAIKAKPDNLGYRLEYLRAYQRNHTPQEVLQALHAAKAEFPKEPSATLALARGYEYIAKNKTMATALYREYLEQAPHSPLKADIEQRFLEWEM